MNCSSKLILATLIWVLAGTALEAQPWELNAEELKRYAKISKMSKKAPEDFSRTPYHLSTYLTQSASSDLEKVRSIYVWLAHNITYDMKSFELGVFPEPHTRSVLTKREALCEGYARLFRALCTEAGIRCEIIQGYSKGYGYKPGSTFEVSNHAWNAVKIKGEWYLVDATWAATSMNTAKEKRPMNDAYFMAIPEEFLITHLPEFKAWQLVNNPISLADFERGESAIQAKLMVPGNFAYVDSLTMLLNLEKSLRNIAYQKRASLFNPNNIAAKYSLGVEYLFRGLDIMDELKQVEDPDINTAIPQIESKVFDLLDEAAFHFTGIKPSGKYYVSAQDLLDETVFDKGIFKYEVAHRLLEIFITFNENEKVQKRLKYEQLVDQYFEEARIYFALIPEDSRYREAATEYILDYLDKNFAEL